MAQVFEVLFNIVLIFFLVLLNGFFVAAEFAIVKVRSTRIAQIDSKRGRVAQKILGNLDAYLSATQLGITLASLALGWAGEPAIARMLYPLLSTIGFPNWLIHTVAYIVAFTLITFLHIVLGEMAPKSFAIRKAEATTLWTATPLDWFYRIFKPFIYVLNATATWLLRRFGIELKEEQQAHTEEEIRMLIAQSHKSGMIDQTELTLFDNVFEFTNRIAREVMVPRVRMVCLYENASFTDNFKIIKETRFTRFPLIGKDKDDLRGIIHIRDIYECLSEGRNPNLSELARPVVIIPETMELKDILRNLQKNRAGMAIVVDEYGGTSGLVTMEDIVEEIFGEIQDEFDNEKPFFIKSGDGTSIDPRLLIEEVNKYFDIEIEDEDNDTIGGWLFSQLDQVPKVGDKVTYGNWVFEVKEMDQHRISRILVTPAKKES
jgi:CBS domain containing-hemolysin-like protein